MHITFGTDPFCVAIVYQANVTHNVKQPLTIWQRSVPFVFTCSLAHTLLHAPAKNKWHCNWCDGACILHLEQSSPSLYVGLSSHCNKVAGCSLAFCVTCLTSHLITCSSGLHSWQKILHTWLYACMHWQHVCRWHIMTY